MPIKKAEIINVKNKITAKSLENGVTAVKEDGSFIYLVYTFQKIFARATSVKIKIICVTAPQGRSKSLLNNFWKE